MAEMNFKVKFPDSRPGGTTPEGDWTYHHVLPWRYYYLCAYVLCMVYRFMLIQDNAASRGKANQVNTGPAMAALATSFWDSSKKEVNAKSLKKEFGDNCLAFKFGAELDAPQLWKRIKAIATSAPNQLDTDVRNSGVFDPDTVARACLGPAFGGFWGINGGQRTDDPEELRENVRPRSGDLNWWTNLSAIGTALESMSPKIKENLPSSRQLEVTMKEDAWIVLNSAIAWLVQNNSRAPAFATADWGFHCNSALVPLRLNENYNGAARGKMGKGGKIFRLLIGNETLAVGNAAAVAGSDFVRVTENGKRDVLYFRNGEDV